MSNSLYQSSERIRSSLDLSTWFIFEDSSRLPDLDVIESRPECEEEDPTEIEGREVSINQALEKNHKRHAGWRLFGKWKHKRAKYLQPWELSENQRKYIDSL